MTALVRDQAGERLVESRGARAVTGSVESPETWAGVSRCRAIIHSAALIAGRFSWERFYEVNVAGARRAAERARQLGVPLVHVSSVAVYGRNYRPGAPVNEAAAFAVLSDQDYYARSKRMAEEAVWEETARGLRAIAIRPCVVYGEGDRLFLPKLVRNLARRRRIPLIGGGTRPLALVHARNVAQAVVLALDPPQWGQAYNVTNDDDITAREFVAAVGRGLGRDLRTISLPAKPVLALARIFDRGRRLLGPSRYPGSMTSAVRFWRGGNPYTSEKARNDLGWAPTIKHAPGVEIAARAILSE